MKAKREKAIPTARLEEALAGIRRGKVQGKYLLITLEEANIARTLILRELKARSSVRSWWRKNMTEKKGGA